MDYLVIGNGYIGNYLKKNLPNVTLIRNKIYDVEKLTHLIRDMYPSHTLINCAGKTGRPNIDWCEDHKDVTFGANVGLPVMIAEICEKLGRYWMHIGSGCIYTGYDEEYTEEDEPNFVGSFYSKTKKWSQEILSDYFMPCVLRIRMPIDEDMGERCYISKILKYAKVGNGIVNTLNSMTYLKDLVGAIQHLSEGGHTGTWNAVNKGSLSAVEILDMWRVYTDDDISYKAIDENELQKYCKAGRSNCILSTKKLEGIGYKMPTLRDRVREVAEKQREKAGV